MQMPFGRHKGQEIASLPQDYLNWLRNNLHLTGKVTDEIDRTSGTSRTQSNRHLPGGARRNARAAHRQAGDATLRFR